MQLAAVSHQPGILPVKQECIYNAMHSSLWAFVAASDGGVLEERRYTWLYMYMLEILQAAIMLSRN